MAGLVPAMTIHVARPCLHYRDCRIKSGNDGGKLDYYRSRHTHFRHPEVLGAKRRASKDDGPSASAVHPSRLASLAPQDDGEGRQKRG
jgi:hypothetical protein